MCNASVETIIAHLMPRNNLFPYWRRGFRFVAADARPAWHFLGAIAPPARCFFGAIARQCAWAQRSCVVNPIKNKTYLALDLGWVLKSNGLKSNGLKSCMGKDLLH